MRVYFFSSETGIYQGEGFQEVIRLDTDEGVTAVAPPTYQRGEVPVFDADRQRWNIQSANEWIFGKENRL